MPNRTDGNPHPLRWTPGKWEIYTYSVGEGDFEGIGIKDQHGNVL